MRTLLLPFLLLSTFLNAQGIDIPEGLEMKTSEDHEKYEPQVLQAMDWLMETPVNEQKEERKKLNAFIVAWLTGTDKVTVILSPKILTFTECSECLVIYMGGWASYVLETGDTNSLNGNQAGIEKTILFYKKNKALLGKNKAMEKYIKKQDRGQLTSYLQARM